MNKLIEKLKKRVEPSDWPKIEKAISFATNAHRGQKRLTGEDYINHPIKTAIILSDFKFGPKTLSAAILHDVYEDTNISLEEIEEVFGKDIKFLVEGISNLGKIKYRGKKRQVESLRKLFLVMAEDIRTILIKLADRLDNLETLYALPPEKAKRIALETMEIYGPIADRLGMGELKGKLEDASFPYAYPKEYEWIKNNVREKYKEREIYLEKVKPIIKKELKRGRIKPLEIHSRPKYYYSLHKKLLKHEMDFSKIYDLVALRIIVKNIEQCYLVLAIIHKLWKPIPGRIKDYIALPKPNGYRSIHTTVFCLDGKITEFQIRTMHMHEEAENGIAAHWHYSEKKGLKKYIKKFIPKTPKKELNWINQLREWQKSFKETSPDEFLESLKIDFLGVRIFVFTPEGDIINLPENACPIDFAYHIHTDIGDHCAGAKVNGKLASFHSKLKNGDIVTIITNPHNTPKRDWLDFAKTGMAKNRIRKFLKEKELEVHIKEQEKSHRKIIEKPIYEKIISIQKVFTKPKIGRVIVSGEKNISVNLAKCCNPKKEDEITGYVTKISGITIHKTSCKNLKFLKKKWPNKFVDAQWS